MEGGGVEDGPGHVALVTKAAAPRTRQMCSRFLTKRGGLEPDGLYRKIDIRVLGFDLRHELGKGFDRGFGGA